MTPGLRQLIVFVSSSAITLLVWQYFWPRNPSGAAKNHGKSNAVATVRSWSPNEIAAKLTAVKNASTASDKLDACMDLSKIPPAEVPALLEQMKSEIESDFSPQAQVLLIRWASTDGEAAANWAWKNFRSGRQWENAFRQIGATWAAHNPSALAKWAIETAEKKPGNRHDSVTLEQAEASDTPLLDSTFLREIPEWLVTEDPYMAHKVILETRLNRYDDFFPRALASVSELREALLACEEMVDPETAKSSLLGEMKRKLLLRWFELDPDDFDRSAYSEQLVVSTMEATASILGRWGPWPETERIKNVNRMVAEVAPSAREKSIIAIAKAWAQSDPGAAVRWLDSLPPENATSTNAARIAALAPHDLTATLDWADQLPPEQRRNSLVPAFDAWTQANPGQRADRTGWPAERAKSWADQEALMLLDGN